VAIVVVGAIIAAACGDATSDDTVTTPDTTEGTVPVGSGPVVPLVEIDRARPAPNADLSAGVAAIDALGYRLLAQVAAAEAAGTNVVISPTSVTIALALMEPGTVGDATDQLHQLLAIDDPESSTPPWGPWRRTSGLWRSPTTTAGSW
jgi:serine protease inhibitor